MLRNMPHRKLEPAKPGTPPPPPPLPPAADPPDQVVKEISDMLNRAESAVIVLGRLTGEANQVLSALNDSYDLLGVRIAGARVVGDDLTEKIAEAKKVKDAKPEGPPA